MDKEQLIYKGLLILIRAYGNDGLTLHHFYSILKDEVECTKKECYTIFRTIQNLGYISCENGYLNLTPKGKETAHTVLVEMIRRGEEHGS